MLNSILVSCQTQNDSLLFAILVLTHYMLPDILLHWNKDRFRNGENSSIICQTWQFIERLKCSHFLYRCLMVSTNQSDPSCFYFRITWILNEGRWFYFFRPLHLVQGLRSLKHWPLQKMSMKIFDQNLSSSLWNRYFSALPYPEREFFDH